MPLFLEETFVESPQIGHAKFKRSGYFKIDFFCWIVWFLSKIFCNNELIYLIREDNEEAFDMLFNKYKPLMIKFSNKYKYKYEMEAKLAFKNIKSELISSNYTRMGQF